MITKTTKGMNRGGSLYFGGPGNWYLSANSQNSGAGGGSFFGTVTTSSTRTSDLSASPLGFYGVAPLLTIRNHTNNPTTLQASSNVYGAFDPFYFNVSLSWSAQKFITLSNVLPSSPDVTSTGGGWSTLTLARSDGAFEVFAFVWTNSASYQLVPALTAFNVDASGAVIEAGSTELVASVDDTVALPQLPGLTPAALPFCFLSQISVSTGTYTAADRSPLLQKYVLAES